MSNPIILKEPNHVVFYKKKTKTKTKPRKQNVPEADKTGPLCFCAQTASKTIPWFGGSLVTEIRMMRVHLHFSLYFLQEELTPDVPGQEGKSRNARRTDGRPAAMSVRLQTQLRSRVGSQQAGSTFRGTRLSAWVSRAEAASLCMRDSQLCCRWHWGWTLQRGGGCSVHRRTVSGPTVASTDDGSVSPTPSGDRQHVPRGTGSARRPLTETQGLLSYTAQFPGCWCSLCFPRPSSLSLRITSPLTQEI